MSNNIIKFPSPRHEQIINDSLGKALDLIGDTCDKIKSGSATKEILLDAMLKLSVLVLAIDEN